MSSLGGCLKRLSFSKDESTHIRRLAKAQREDGLSATEANLAAVDELIEDTLRIRQSVLDQLKTSLSPNQYRQLRRAPAEAVVNIGLNVNDGSTISAQEALSALKLAGASVLSHQVRESNTEPTLIAELAEPLSPEKATALSATLKQDAIAQRLADGTGALYGPAADKWGPFNPEYFLEPEAGPRLAPAPSIEKLARALPTTTVPSKTKFLLPDGRRLTWPESKVDNNAHYELARHAGVWLDDVIREGAIRYVPFFGIDVGKVLTTKQAETIVDDWYAYQDTLQVDVKDNLGSVVVSHDFDVLGQEITPSFLQDWVKFNLEKGDTPRFNPNGTAKLVHYSKEKDLAVIDPKYHGTGQIGAERLRQMNEGKAYIPRSFFYRAKTKIEPRFKGLTKYQVEVPESSLVDLATLKGTPTERERAAKTAGYKGYYNSESSMPNVVAMFEPVGIDGPRFSPKQTETESFKKWFGKSVVVNPDGSPKEMYHGSIEEFHVFDKEKIRPFDYDAEFNGFWFSDDPSTGPAMRDARHRKSVYLRMENPAPPNVWRPLLKEASQKFEQYKSKGARTEHDTVRMLLQERGYDGVFFADRPAIDEKELNRTGVVRFKNARGHEYELRKEDLHNLGSPGYELYDYNPFHPEESSHITGYETLEQFLSQNETVVVVFEPTQIKSSDANSGTFDPNNPDIRFAPKSKQPKSVPRYQVDQPGALDKIIRVLQDKAIDIKRIVESVQKAGLTVPDELNPILKEEMYMKRAEQRASDFTNDELRPLVNAMRLSKVTLEQLDHYLQARHIIRDRVNHHLQQINPDLQGTPQYDKLAGMTDAEARAILAKVDPKIMEPLAKRVDKMVEKTRDLMVAYGLEKQSTIDQWRQFYTAYVPLHREGFEEDGHPTGTGRSVRGSTVKGRTGSDLGVTNILANVAQARDQIITRGEKQRPVIAMAGLMMLYPNPEIATLDKPAQIQMTDPATGLITTVPGNLTNYTVPTVRRYDPVDGVVKTYPDPMYKGRDNVVNFRIDGQDYAIVFNERNERAMEAAKAFKELDTAKLNGIMAAIAPYTRYLASINTQYNPIFGIVNFVRDAQFAVLALGSTPLAGKKIDVFKNAVSSLAGIYQDARAVRLGRHPSSATAQMWERFQHVGGPTGYRDLFFSSTDRAAEIERMLKPNDLGLITGPQALGKRLEETWLLQTLSDYNTTMENSLRLGVFMTAVQQGMSDIQAASYAKNITVNFNKKGQIGAQMGSLFAFFNANVQGTARIFETVFERTQNGVALSAVGKKIVVGGLLVGILQTFALAMAGFGDDEPPEYIKARNLVIPIPGTKKGYGLLPMPLGFNLLPNVGRAAAEAIRAGLDGRDIKPMMRLANLVGAFYGTFSPLGGTGGPIQEMLPTVADPIAAVVSNKDWTGKSISKEDQSSLDPTPGHTRTRDTASYWATFLSKAINWATGGTNYTPGALSPTPDMIDYLVEQATGGIGRELSKTSQVIQSLATGEELPFYKVPLAGRFAGSAEGTTAIRSTFYDNVKAVNLAHREFLGRAKDRTGDAHEYLRSHPEGRLYESANSIERTIGELQKVKRDLIKQDAPRATIRMREEQITGLMKRFNDQVEGLRKGAP